ncbi:hypothetical protein CROQUDRAFT_87702 [Cronartium quercuum f. sp. fusiforme G11]|uniref:Uncharacterized protein n=1 Tax=Cronartium quercuum f. sp. fusiforme G11 TaxID=708437 RepID=A0A9P6TFD6_9BASI|nr:hypothetical protein CROQUDRAFT_87702 [Cronartium quercuum f. sp. fusiforme G11]
MTSTLTSSSSSSSSSMVFSDHLHHQFHSLISILPFPIAALLHFLVHLVAQSIYVLYSPSIHLRTSLLTFYQTIFDRFLNLLFHILQLSLVTARPFPLSSSTVPTDSYLSPFTNPLPSTPSLSPSTSTAPNSRASILITNNYDNHPLALELGLQFSELGYHVFIQVSSQSQLSEVIVGWQRLKSQLNKRHQRKRRLAKNFFASSSAPSPTGTLIPLLYLTHDLEQRNEAISTVRAYAREESLDMISLVHVIHPHFIRRTLPPSPLHNPMASAQTSPNLSPVRSTRRLSVSSTRIPDYVGHPSPPSSTLVPSPSVFYPTSQIPLTVCGENFLFDAFNDLILGPLSTTQDFLPTLVALRGRVVHVCTSGDGIARMTQDALRVLGDALGSELKAFRIPVSLVTVPASGLPFEAGEQAKRLTSDLRSMLTEDSDPFILRIFERQARLVGGKVVTVEEAEGGEEVFRMVRSAIETRFPRRAYPLSLWPLLRELVDGLKDTVRGVHE